MMATVRPTTSEELAAIKSSNAPVVRATTQDELDALSVSTKPPPEESPTIINRLVSRMFGTDVDDPFEMERLGTVALGAIEGGIIGSRVPPLNPVINPITGALTGGLIGATAGAVAPEATLEVLEFLKLIPEGAREEIALDDKELRRVVSGEALLEITTAGLAIGIRVAGRTTAKLASGIGKKEAKLANEAAKEGINLAPFQVGAGKTGRAIINIMGRFPFIGSSARAVGGASEEAIKVMRDKLPERIAPLVTSATLGNKIFKEGVALIKATSGHFSNLYDDLFLEANRLGVSVAPKNTEVISKAILEALIEKRVPKISGGAAKASQATEIAVAFIKENFDELGELSLAQADELMLKIDQLIGSSPKAIKKTVAKFLSPLKGSLKTDILKNMNGEGAEQIGRKLAEIDSEFSETMAFLFETSTAKKFGRVIRQGLRATVSKADKFTTTPIDKLAKIVVDMDSPQAIDELSRLVSPSTFKAIGARALGDIFDSSLREVLDGSLKLDADRLARNLGLLGGDGTRLKVVERLLEGTGLDKKTLLTMVDAASKIADAPIPNFSTFIARRAGIGGAKGVIRGVLPFLAFSGAGAAGGGAAGALIGGLMFFGGARMLVSAISNPLSSRFIKDVISEESTSIIKRQAFLRMVRVGFAGMRAAGELTADMAREIFAAAKEASQDLFPDENS